MSENESAPAENTAGSESVEQVVTEEVVTEPVAVSGEDTSAIGATEPVAESSEQDARAPSVAEAPAVPPEEITYHAVEKDGQVTAIWEMQGRKHLRTIDPRSRQGQDILRLYTSDHHDDTPPPESSDAASV
jgi:hypothetical protein